MYLCVCVQYIKWNFVFAVISLFSSRKKKNVCSISSVKKIELKKN